MKYALLTLLILVGGCAQVAQDVKSITYDDALEATRRNHETRFQWRADCRALVNAEYQMWLNQAILAESDGELETASQYRSRAASVLVDNFPDLVTIGGLRAAKDASQSGGADVYPLECFVRSTPE